MRIAAFLDELDKIAQEMDIGQIAEESVSAHRARQANKPIAMSRYRPRGGSARKATPAAGKVLGFLLRRRAA